MEKIKEILRQTLNIIIGCSVLGIAATLCAFIVGIAANAVITAFKYGYGLW
jgi:hypothetical protein